MKTKWMWLVGSIALALVGCASSAEVGEQCEETDDCADNLICPKAGVYKGHCTTECDDSSHCSTTHGSDYFCHIDSVCVKECFADSECGNGLTCDTSGSPDHCSVD